MEIEDLYNSIIADSKVDSEEVLHLKNILYQDGKIDKEEADLLFKINNACSGNDNCPEWEMFFVSAISDFLLKDDLSPGEVDENEAKWLIESIGSDGQVDRLEKRLLNELNSNAKSIPNNLKSFIQSNL